MNSITLALSLLSGFGLLIIVIGMNIKESTGNILREDEDGDLQIHNVAEVTIIEAMLADFSKKIGKEDGDLESKLRKSGYYYNTLTEYHAKKMIYALAGMLFVLTIGLLLPVNFLIVMVVAAVFAVIGFLFPNYQLNDVLRKKKESISLSITFGIERIALFLQVGMNMDESLHETRNVGLFGKIAEYMSQSYSSNATHTEVVENIKQDYPYVVELWELFELIRISKEKGANVTHIFKSKAEMLREKMSNKIVQAGQDAKNELSFNNMGFLMIASMIVIVAPLALAILNSGVMGF